MATRIIRANEYRRMRWKNGQGETAEVAISPSAAALDDFDWRISMATVEADGPFSAFNGIDRTLTILAGAGLRLLPNQGAAVELTVSSAPFSFEGGVAVDAVLIAGPVTDLNLMTRRDRAWHRVRRVAVGGVPVAGDAASAFLVAPGGASAQVSVEGLQFWLEPLDTLEITLAEGPVEILTVGAAGVLLVEIGLR
ncbi:MAG: HutD family protein [Proteobacteria bacterium]|nr:HutD family protein [Pseudomonadota bacterium]